MSLDTEAGMDVTRADAETRERREALRTPSAIASAPPPTVDAEWLCRHMGRHDLNGVGLARILGVTPAAVGQWMKGNPIPAARQRQLMDLFGEPLSLRDATWDDLMGEVFRRAAARGWAQ